MFENIRRIRMLKDLLQKFQEFVSGYKTYLVAAAAIIAAVSLYSQGQVDAFQLLEAILVALGLGTLRSGMKKIGKD